MRNPRVLLLSTVLLTGLGLPCQQDILSPFRNPQESRTIPERYSEPFRQLRIMQSIAENVGPVRFDELGREVCDDPRWKDAYEVLRGYYVDPANRGPGFALTILSNVTLTLGGLIGALVAYL